MSIMLGRSAAYALDELSSDRQAMCFIGICFTILLVLYIEILEAISPIAKLRLFPCMGER